jgi:hypothetical protein
MEKGDAKKIYADIYGIINGLQTFAFNNNPISYRLLNTRRLTSDAAKLTGLYYNNSLKSISDIEGLTRFNSKFFSLFHPNGGISIAKLQKSTKGYSETNFVRFICLMAREILSRNKELEVALLAPYI